MKKILCIVLALMCLSMAALAESTPSRTTSDMTTVETSVPGVALTAATTGTYPALVATCDAEIANCSTIVEGCSFFRGMKLRQWFEEGLMDCVASDAHGSRKRPFQMRAAYRALRDAYGRKYADRLTKLL